MPKTAWRLFGHHKKKHEMVLCKVAAQRVAQTPGRQTTVVMTWVLCLLMFSIGCGTIKGDRKWGEDTTLSPGWERVKQAAWHAAVAPETWAPAAGALVLQINNANHKVQRWAATNTPLFGSQDRADDMSDDLWVAASAIWFGTGLVAPSGNESDVWAVNKVKGLGLEGFGVVALRNYVDIKRKSVGLANHNDLDEGNFESHHVMGTAFYNTLSSRHLDAFDLSGGTITATRIGLGAITMATAWARVEANHHYPADVLMSIAFGHFMGAFITDAFITADMGRDIAVIFEPSGTGISAMVVTAF